MADHASANPRPKLETPVADHRYMQVLRSIDKFDKIGRDGVVALLQKPVEEFGAALDPDRAELIGMFLDINGATDEETLANARAFFRHADRVRSRLDLMVMLEKAVEPDGKTKWDRLLALHANEDQSWNDGGRPANIGWALDDMVQALASIRTAEKCKK